MITAGKMFKQWIIDKTVSPEDAARIDEATAKLRLNSAGFDDWGLNPETLKAAFGVARWFYSEYFRVETVGIDEVPEGRVLLVANHGGQIPIDGLLITISMLASRNPPRVIRGMIERWVPSLPFVSTLFSRCGQVVGDTKNCLDLLKDDNAVLVFPEGVKGSGKTFFERYQLQKFGTGFVRMALETKAPIVPVAVIGCEEIYPAISELRPLAKMLGVPYLPVTPFFPFFGPLGMLPLPCKVTLRFGKPITFAETTCEGLSESRIFELAEQVKQALQAELSIGLDKRQDMIFTGAGK